MSSERMKILDMVAEGKLTVEEATQLLENISQTETIAVETPQATLVNAGPSDEEGGELMPSMAHMDQPPATPSMSEHGVWDRIKRAVSSLGSKEKYTEDLDWELDGANIEAIMAHTTNGSITFEGTSAKRITVQAHKMVRAPSMDEAEAFAQQVQIKIEQQEGMLRITKAHPKPPIGVDVSVSYVIQGPDKVNLTLETTNGKILAEQVEGVVKTRSTNGKIRLNAITGQVEARTTNGGIQVEVIGLNDESRFDTTNGSINVGVQHGIAPIRANTSNGSINLTLPADFSGQLDAQTVNGKITSELATILERQSRTHLIGQIGEGGDTPLKLRTTNGSIRLAV
jgi:DUF4097 and DUF4098 domain-containing protein YvlB